MKFTLIMLMPKSLTEIIQKLRNILYNFLSRTHKEKKAVDRYVNLTSAVHISRN